MKYAITSTLAAVLLMVYVSANAFSLFGNSTKDRQCSPLIQWTDILLKAYPNNNFRDGNIINEKLIPRLFYDETFVPVFGKPYDRLSEYQREDFGTNWIQRCIVDPCGDDPANKRRSTFRGPQEESPEAERWRKKRCSEASGVNPYNQWQLYMVKAAFSRNNPYPRPDEPPLSPTVLASTVASARDRQRSLNTALKELSTLPKTLSAFDSLSRIEINFETLIQPFWPKEIEETRQKIADKRAEIAPYALEEAVTEAITVARQKSSLEPLDQIRTKRAALFKQVDPAISQGWLEKLNQERGAMFAPVLAVEKARFAKMTGLAGVAEGAEWYARVFRWKYLDLYPDVEEVRTMNDELILLRAKSIEANKERLANEIRKAGDRDQMLSLFDKYLPLDMDWKDDKQGNYLLGIALNKELTAIEDFKGMNGLVQNASWFQSFSNDYNRYSTRKAYHDAEQIFWKIRDRLIEENRNELVTMAREAQSESELSSIADRYLRLENGRRDDIVESLNQAVVDSQRIRATNNEMPTYYDVLQAVTTSLATALPNGHITPKRWGRLSTGRNYVVELSLNDLSCKKETTSYMCSYSINDREIALPSDLDKQPYDSALGGLLGNLKMLNKTIFESSVISALGTKKQSYDFRWSDGALVSENMSRNYQKGYRRFTERQAEAAKNATSSSDNSNCLRGMYTTGQLATALTFGGKLCH